MASEQPIVRFWTRADGAACFLYKRQDGWWLTVEREGAALKTLRLTSAVQALSIASDWRAIYMQLRG